MDDAGRVGRRSSAKRAGMLQDDDLETGHILVGWLARDRLEGVQEGGRHGLNLGKLHVRMKQLGG